MVRKHKLLVLTSSFPNTTGAWKGSFVYELSKRLCSDFDVFVLTPYVADAASFETLDGIRIVRYKFLPFNFGKIFNTDGILPVLKKRKIYWLTVPFFLLAQFLSLKKILQKENITLIHAHWIIPQGMLAVIYKKFFDRELKILGTAHGSDIFAFQGKIGTRLKKYILHSLDQVTVVSGPLKEKVEKIIDLPNVSVYPMGIDTKLFSPEKRADSLKVQFGVKKELLLFVGRLSEEKGIKYLIESMPEVLKDFPEATLVIIGDGVLKQELHLTVKQTGLVSHVKFLGPLPHYKLPAWFATADVCILPSLFEGAGLVLYEALSCGCIAITSDIPAFSNVIADGITGFIVPKGNSERLALTTISVLKNLSEYNALRKRCRILACDTFNWDNISRKYVEVLKCL